MVYKYLYQDRENKTHEGEIKARDRAEAYTLLRKQKIRPYRVIGDDPFNWRPWAIAISYAVLLSVIAVLIFALLMRGESAKDPKMALSAEAAEAFRARAKEALDRAPEAYRFTVWKGLNARLEERGLNPLPRPEGLGDEASP